MKWLNFMIIIQVTNKVFIVLFTRRILLDINTFSICGFFIKKSTFMAVKKIFFFNISVNKR